VNPGGGALDSNPYGLLAEPGGQVVADAAANALLRVAANGDISTLAVFPSRAQGRPTDAVPTSVALGPDGAYYVAELSGVPFATGAANIYRVVPGEAPTVAWSGFTTVIDIAFGPDGSLYVLEHSTGPVFFALPGRLLRVAPDGTRTTVIDGLTRPGSVAVGPDGALFVSNRSISIGTGEVLRIEP
jgi:sugar lactone lactonase YvrE